jgi:RNA-directed DNA polymerase
MANLCRDGEESKSKGSRMSLSTETIRIQNRIRQHRTSGKKAWDLYRWMMNPWILWDAYRLVKANKGKEGTDGVTWSMIEGKEKDFLRLLQSKIREKLYNPTAVRRAYIPKADGKQRPLGIPTLEDRIVQRALVLVMEPIYEEIFQDNSYGFRPNKKATDCVKDLGQQVFTNRFVVEVDIKGYFDNVNHKRLIKYIEKEIVDPRITNLIKKFLTAGYQEKGKIQATNKGTPQGGPLSPLLANIYLHYILDTPWKERKSKLIRYADDFVICCRTRYEAEREFSNVKELLEKAGLEMHEQKSKIVDMSNQARGYKSKFNFLGFKLHLRSFKDNPKRFWIARQPSEEARKELRKKLKTDLWPTLTLDEANLKLRQIWFGWVNYFRHGNSNRIIYREFSMLKRAVKYYLRRKFRHQRRPVPWSKLRVKIRQLFHGLRPVGVCN